MILGKGFQNHVVKAQSGRVRRHCVIEGPRDSGISFECPHQTRRIDIYTVTVCTVQNTLSGLPTQRPHVRGQLHLSYKCGYTRFKTITQSTFKDKNVLNTVVIINAVCTVTGLFHRKNSGSESRHSFLSSPYSLHRRIHL